MTPALSDKTPEEIRLYNAMVRKLFPELEGDMLKAKEEAWRGSETAGGGHSKGPA